VTSRASGVNFSTRFSILDLLLVNSPIPAYRGG
jgi:hypothetical protein